MAVPRFMVGTGGRPARGRTAPPVDARARFRPTRRARWGSPAARRWRTGRPSELAAVERSSWRPTTQPPSPPPTGDVCNVAGHELIDETTTLGTTSAPALLPNPREGAIRRWSV